MTVFDAPPPTNLDDHSCCSRPLERTSGRARVVGSPIRVIGLAVAAVLLIEAGGTDDGPGLCVFRRCTGGYCPGCGLTRAAKHLTRGQFSAAWHDHPWVVLVAAQAVVAGVVLGVLHRIGRRIDTRRLVPIAGSLNVALMFGIWITRLVDGSIPRFF